jgi:translation initiation factor 1A
MYQTRIRNGKKKVPRHRVLEDPDEGQEYAVIKDMLGSGRVNVVCEDAKTRMGRIRGSMRKYGNKVIIEKGDIVIVAKREFEDDKLDIVHKYNYDECTYLSREGSLPQNIHKAWMSSMDIGGACTNHGDEEYIVFGHNDADAAAHVAAAAEVDVDNI